MPTDFIVDALGAVGFSIDLLLEVKLFVLSVSVEPVGVLFGGHGYTLQIL
jgi:hypothetical protein